jgi:transposase-like protein
VKVAGRWRYVYPAIDQAGQVIDVFASSRRDSACARRFFQRALGTSKTTPREVTTDLAPTYPMVLRNCCRARGIAPIGIPTTGSRPITVVSRRDCGRCAGASRTAAPG